MMDNVIGEIWSLSLKVCFALQHTVMELSRTCLGYDNTNIYSVSHDSINSYKIEQRITSVSRNRALNNTNTFVTCFTHQNELYIGAVDPTGTFKFLSYRISSTPQQPQMDYGSPSFDNISDMHQLDITKVVSMIPTYQPTFDSTGGRNETTTSSDQDQRKQSCVLLSANNPGQFNGLYQVCLGNDDDPDGASFQKFPFPFNTATTPLLATDKTHSSIILLGYPNANSIYIYRNLDDLSMPNSRYQTNIPIPSKGSVQVLNDAATEFLIFDYDRKIIHLQLDSNNNKQINLTYTHEIDNNGQRNKGVIELGNHQLFTVLDKSDSDEYVFEEISLAGGLPSTSIQQTSQESSDSQPYSSSSPILSTTTIGIIIGASITLIICLILLGLWLFRRNRRNKNTQEDDVRTYLNLQEDEEEADSYDRSPPNHNRMIDTERGNQPLGSNMINRSIDPPPPSSKPSSLRHKDTIGTASNNINRNISVRRGIDTFIQRMVSLRSPLSPSSTFSLFSNISSTPPPVIDKYHKVKQVHFPLGASELMEPTFFDTNDTLIVNGHYQLLDDQGLATEEESCRIPGYATRTIQHATKAGEPIRTLHYYPANQRNAFIRNINFTIQLRESKRIIRHHDSLALTSPTQANNYQYYWISELCMAQQSLQYLLHKQQQDHPDIVDTRQFNFMSLTVLSLLSCLRDVHSHDCCHLGLSLDSFYYQKVSAITEWYIGRFDQAHVIGQPEGYGIMLNTYSAPELVKEAIPMESTATPTTTTHQKQHYYCYKFSPRPALDCWSLGCVIYEVATGIPLFKDMYQLYQLCSPSSSPSDLISHLQQAYDQVDLIHPSFRACLEHLLQLNPIERSCIALVLDDWIKANQLDDEDADLD